MGKGSGFKTIPNHPNYSISRSGRVMNKRTKRELKPSINQGRYAMVHLDGKGLLVHRLVALTWLVKDDRDYSKLVVHHRDNDTLNNRMSNLVWCSRQEHLAYHKVMREYMRYAVTTKKFKDFEKIRLTSLL